MDRRVLLDGSRLFKTPYKNYYGGLDGHVYRKKYRYVYDKRDTMFKKTQVAIYELLREFKDGRKRPKVCLCVKGKRFNAEVDELIMFSLHGDRREHFRIVHKNGNLADNRPENLRYKFKKDLWDVFNDEEFKMWKNKLDKLKGNKGKEFNNNLLKEFIANYRDIMKDKAFRKKFFNKHLK